MAIIFELYIETETEAAMAAMETFWARYETRLPSDDAVVWTLSKHTPRHLCLWSPTLGGSGVESYEHAAKLSECGIDLAIRLVSAPEFVFARIGIEVDGYTRADFVQEYQNDGEPWIPEGTIICERLWEDLGCPTGLSNFRPKYYWNKYKGEPINPVFREANLYAKWKQLPGN